MASASSGRFAIFPLSSPCSVPPQPRGLILHQGLGAAGTGAGDGLGGRGDGRDLPALFSFENATLQTCPASTAHPGEGLAPMCPISPCPGHEIPRQPKDTPANPRDAGATFLVLIPGEKKKIHQIPPL